MPSANNNIDINQVDAMLHNGSDMFWDLQSSPRYEVPKGSGKHVAFASSLWVGGTSPSGALHVAASTYRQTGNDFYAGPYRSNGNYNCATGFDQQWQKIWKVNRSEVMQFQSDFWAGTVNFNNYPEIETWPGNGDTTQTEDWQMAPFVDMDGDGVYDPAGDGDFPCFPGDQGLWWVTNDDGAHTETGSTAFPLQMTNMVYGYNCQGGYCPDSVFDYLTFYHREITNKSSSTYTDFYIGFWLDTDIGNYTDDYVGCDTIRNMTFSYNGDPDDETASGYGLNPPAFGSLLLPNDDISKMAGTMVYENDFSDYGNPELPEHYYNYLKSTWKNGDHLVDNGQFGRPANGTGPLTNFAYPGDPGFCGGVGNGWSEVSAGNQPFDRRSLQTFGPFTIQPGETIHLDYALLFARGYYNDNLGSVCELQKTADIVLSFWNPAMANSCSGGLPTSATASVEDAFDLNVFPNPNGGTFHVTWNKQFKGAQSLKMIDIQGRTVKEFALEKSRLQLDVDAQELNAGLYFLQMNANGKTHTTKVVIKH